ncbi:UNVERIFIED_ORG: NAD(P)-dependent dehydrogenase (short-subunit alcohol dehydrogenase family) [Burkholderia cepacia]|nr:NAD(P)-dependent dehydrogenase (short-subunit alcohol dehydrogenase family) [Burkholderia cepacia]
MAALYHLLYRYTKSIQTCHSGNNQRVLDQRRRIDRALQACANRRGGAFRLHCRSGDDIGHRRPPLTRPAGNPAMSVSKKFAAVTGAGSGIGRAAALALAQAGFTVALLGRTEASLRETQQDAIRAAGGDAQVFPVDVTDEASVDHAFARIAQQFGRLDVLFNNAGRNAPVVSLDEYELDVWNSVVATNLTGVFLCARAAWQMMKAQTPQGGRIINNGSISAHAPRPDTIAYTATKHAVTGITKSLALDGRRYNIACGQIDIGNAATSLTERMTQGVPQADGSLAPEARMDVAHVANAIVQMANLPLDTNILNMTIMATAMPFVGRG